MTFEKLDRIVELTVKYTTLGTLSIGAGDQPQSTVDSPLMRIGGKPVIPGSSLKGALRSNIEAILAQSGEKVCVPITAIPNTIKRDDRAGYAASIGRKFPCDPKTPCRICQMFGTAGGAQGLSGRVIVLDALLTNTFDPAILTERTHVAITRDTRAQAGGALVSVEAVDAGVEFSGIIRLVNPEDWMVGAILRGLEVLGYLGVGAKKTSGYGQLQVEPQQVVIRKLTATGWEATAGDLDAYRRAFDTRLAKATG